MATDPTPTVDEGDGLRASVLRHGVVAALVVAVVAGMFWIIGETGDVGDGAPVVADGPDDTDDADDVPDQDEAPTEPDGDAEPEDEAPDPDGDDAADDQDGEDTSADDADDTSGDEDVDGADGDGEPDDEATQDEPSDDATEDEPEQPTGDAIDPATITVQVLDGYQQDGGAAAGALADEIEAAGYDVIARNPALRYDVTAVLYTAGNEDAGRQIAAEIGAAEVREQPGNLSTAVAVHVVVGADRG